MAERPQRRPGDECGWALAAQACEARGAARAALLDAGAALDDFEQAEALWSRLGATDGVCRTWVHGAMLQLRGLGNLHEAALRLDQARRSQGPRGSDTWARVTLARAELLHLRGWSGEAADLVEDAAAALQEAVTHAPAPGDGAAAPLGRAPAQGSGAEDAVALAGVAVHGLAVSRGAAQDRFARLLCEQLARVTPPPDRLALLAGIERCAPLSGDRALRTRLRRLVPSPVETLGSRAELGRAALLDAELDRLVGRPGDAVMKLERAWRATAPEPSRAALIAAAVRAGARRLIAVLAREELQADGSAPVLGGAALVQAAAALDDPELRERALERAGELLGDRGAEAGAWPARRLELLARDAATAERALGLRRRAAALYEAIGDDLRRDRALGRTRGSATPDGAGEPELRVTVRLSPATPARAGWWTVSTGGNGRPSAAERACVAVRSPVGRMLGDPERLGRDLGALLLTAAGGARGDLGLCAEAPEVCALPWELAAPALEAAGLRLFRPAPHAPGEPAGVSAVQGALNRLGRGPVPSDGELGPATRAALAALQGELGLPATGLPDPVTVQRLHGAVAGGARPRVAILRGATSGVPVEGAYARAGFGAEAVDGAAELKRLLRERPAAVLHLDAGFADHHGVPAIELRGPARLTAIAFGRLIARDAPSPLVVLDPPAPRTARDAAAQLLLRNAFASELMAVGTVRALLAAGLTRDSRRQREALAGALREGGDAHEVASALRETALAFAATALFARAPSVRFPVPG